MPRSPIYIYIYMRSSGMSSFDHSTRPKMEPGNGSAWNPKHMHWRKSWQLYMCNSSCVQEHCLSLSLIFSTYSPLASYFSLRNSKYYAFAPIFYLTLCSVLCPQLKPSHLTSHLLSLFLALIRSRFLLWVSFFIDQSLSYCHSWNSTDCNQCSAVEYHMDPEIPRVFSTVVVTNLKSV